MDQMTRTLLGRVLLCLALLAGWQSALVHPLTHVDKNGDYVHLTDGQPKPKKSDSSGLCDVLAALAACAPSVAAVFIPVSDSQAVFNLLAAAPRLAEPPPFLSQGPPLVL
jgi:hypothetical protein